MANNDKENKIEKFTKEAIGKTLNQFNKEIGIADLVEINKNQDRILNGILSQVNDENTEKTEKSNIITLDNSTDGIVELKEIQGDTNVNVSKIEEMPITHDIGDKEGNVFTLNEIPKGAISIGEIQGNTMVNCNKDDKKELVLMKDLSTQGYGNVTLTEGVDGGLVDVALEGNTMVNVCDQKDPVAITKSYTVETGNHVALQGEYDGKCRPVVTGNTLVNLNITPNSTVNISSPTNGGMTQRRAIYDLPYNLTKGKDYTVLFNISNLTKVGEKSLYISLSGGRRETVKFTPVEGLNIVKVNDTNMDYDLESMWIYFMPGTLENADISDVIILEGDYTDKTTPDYFEGLQSTFEDNLVTQEMVDAGEELAENLGKYKVDYVVTGKNKFDGSVLLNKAFDTSSYKIIDQINSQITNFIKVTPNTTYTISNTPTYKNRDILVEYDNTKQFIQWSFVSSNKFTVGDNTEYVIYYYYRSLTDVEQMPPTNLQLEEGSTATTYEPYKEFTKTFYLNSPLLEGDTIEQQGDNVVHVHRYGKVVLDGSADEIWEYNTTEPSELKSYKIFNEVHSTDNQSTIGYCDKIPYTKWADMPWNKTYDTISVLYDIRVYSSKTTLDEFKLWLQSNPITLVQQLKSPQYEVISQNDTILCDSYVNGHLDVDSVVPIERVGFGDIGFNVRYLYSNTQYNLQFEADNVGKLYWASLGGIHADNIDIIKGINKISITTGTSVTYRLYLNGIGFNASNIVVTEATDQDFGYFEGMKSVGECEDLEVVSSNKNLFNKDTDSLIGGKYWRPDTGELEGNGVVSDSNKNFADPKKYPCKSQYVTFMSTDNTNQNHILRICFYSPQGLFISQNEGSELVNVSIPHNAGYYKICGDLNLLDTTILFESDEIIPIPTDYVPRVDNTQTLTHEPLRAVGNVKDKYVLIDGKWYIEKNCAEVMLDGSDDEGWINTGYGGHPTRNTFETVINNVKFISDGDATPAISSSWKNIMVIDIPNEDNSFRLGASKGNIGYFLFTPSTSIIPYRDTNAWRTYLANNPITVIYQLASPTYEPINYNPFTVYSDVTHIRNNSTIPCNMVIKNTGYNCLLKPSTTYTVSSNLGLNTVTTPSTLTEDCLRFYDKDTSNVTTMKDVLVLEGDWTSKANLIPSNFSGIESCFEQALVTDENDANYGKYKVTAKVIGKNLFDGELALGSLNNSTGETSETDLSLRNINFIPVISGSTITVSNDMGYHNYIYEYDGNYKFIKYTGHTSDRGAKTIILNNSTKFIKFRSISGNNENDLNVKYQVEQGDTVTAYESYKESNVTFYINEPLRGVGDVKDRIFIKEDKVLVERKCSSYTFDGSKDEGWVCESPMQHTIYAICIFNSIKGRELINNKVLSYSYSIYNKDIEGMYTTDDQRIKIKVSNSKLSTLDANGFKQWLQQNPITVVYQLAEPTYEEVEYSSNRLILNTFNNESFNNSILFLDTNISPKLSFKPLYEELVYVKNSTKYYIQFNAVGSGEVVINLGGTELTTEIVEGYNCIPITTPSESTNLMVISGQGITIGEVVISEVVCGGYYKGLQSCFEEHMESGKYVCTIRGIALDGSKVNGIKLYLDEPLRGIGDAKDRLCIKNGKLMVERKCKEIILNGSNYVPRCLNTMNEGIKRWELYKNEDIMTNLSNANVIINDRYKVVSPDATWGNIPYEDGICANSVGHSILIYLDKYNDDSNTSKNALISELQENPVKIVYKLVESTYEEVTNEYGLPIVFEGYENGIVYIDSAVTPTTHIKYTSNNQLATTLSEAEEQNIATQEDINMNVITYMMDIDMILTDMEMSNDTSVMAVRRDNSNENMLDRMSEEDKKVYRDNTVVMLEKMITAQALEKEDIERRINMYYNKNRISKEQYKYLKSLL